MPLMNRVIAWGALAVLLLGALGARLGFSGTGGGGAAGSIIASRLSENPNFKVLLVEAGPNNEDILELTVPGCSSRVNGLVSNGSRYTWNFTTVSQVMLNDHELPIVRGRVLGGSSSISGMQYVRGSSDDYDAWAKATGDRWWSWKGAWPYFKKNERWMAPNSGRNITGRYDPRVHGYGGQAPVGLPNSEPSDFAMRCVKNTTWKPDYFPFTSDVNSGRPRGVVGNGERASERKTITVKKELILSAGVYGTPHTLLNSRIGNKTQLRAVGVQVVHDLPDVGQGLREMPTVTLSWIANVTDPAPTDQTAALAEWQANRTGPLSEFLLGRVQCLWHRIPKDDDIWKKHEDPSSGPTTPHLELWLRGGMRNMSTWLLLNTPQSRGTVKLGSSDPLDPPVIDYGFLSHPFDREALKEGIRLAKKFFSGPVCDGYITSFLGPDPDMLSEVEFDAVVRDNLSGFSHAVGTSAMTRKGDKRGVVNPDLKVKGVKLLRIVDGSVVITWVLTKREWKRSHA
ncbi:aryl-alcohol oxidase [Coprinopsis cinerea okayama7|uniref:pyranose dehydrogenase (acceptor) n=1 Tax=Coprinopsis cinerea (strain Okayama-7 / 130 / ATCC MYA-4618 / FGSC 9003) TaxID=240176 RepID=A8N898_COPC7|nr:aryl-alcohol oxidase [Coprinopsis cinerea okayama7\|eukprot:XP_001831054.2 aryl-alcohol oxidase [Coprinopsis cinerea okayama7\